MIAWSPGRLRALRWEVVRIAGTVLLAALAFAALLGCNTAKSTNVSGGSGGELTTSPTPGPTFAAQTTPAPATSFPATTSPAPTASPSAAASPSASAAATQSAAPTQTQTAAPTATQTQAPTAAPTASPTATPSPTPSPSPSPSPSPTVAPTPNIARPAVPATGLIIHGRVTNAATGAGVGNACVTVGPPIVCFTRTSTGSADNVGYFVVDLSALAAPSGSTWDIYVVQSGCAQFYSGTFAVSGPVQKNAPLTGCAP